jgi:hypothetical protein
MAYQAVLSPECLDVINSTGSVQPSWEPAAGAADYAETTMDWYTHTYSGTEWDYNISFTTEGEHSLHSSIDLSIVRPF